MQDHKTERERATPAGAVLVPSVAGQVVLLNGLAVPRTGEAQPPSGQQSLFSAAIALICSHHNFGCR